MGRLSGTSTQYGSLPGVNFQNAYTYDAASNRRSLTAPDGSISTYGYDTLNRLNGLANTWAGSFGFGYDALSRRTQLTRPNGITTNYSYDAVSHLLAVLHKVGADIVDGASYSYDAAGNRSSKGNYLNGITSNYTYDPLYELTQVTQGGSTTESYSYDSVGNRLSSSGVPTYSYSPSNELTSNSSGSYTFDANGNALSDPSGKCDPFGRRVQKSGPLGTTNYLYDGDNLAEELDGSGNLKARYTQTQNIDEFVAESRLGTTIYYDADAVSSSTSLSNTSGTLATTYTYDSFGNVTPSGTTITNPFQYADREFDTETGLYYFRARYYDPRIGRFVSEDPIGLAGGINSYRYVSNRSVNFRDPLGLCPPEDPCAIPNHPWYASVDINIVEADMNGPAFQLAMVLPHMPWDYKQQGPYDDFGNFNFGATGAGLGYPDSVLLRGAGGLKVIEWGIRHQPEPPDIGSPFGDYPYGNEKDKQEITTVRLKVEQNQLIADID